MINGTIANIVPLGQYSGQNGLIYTFTMTINSQNGAITGEIGSKSNVYPMSIGESITVETRQDAHGTKFKKINPQYQPVAPPQAPQGPSQAAQSQNDTQTQILRQCAGKCASWLVAGTIVTFEERFKEAERWVGYFQNGLTPNLLPAKERFGDGALQLDTENTLASTTNPGLQEVRDMPEDQIPFS